MESPLLDQLGTLSHPQRMAVFRLLVRRCPDPLPAGEIARVLGLKPSTASVYLAALTQAGLIRRERRATSLLYQFNPDAARGMIDALLVDCCRGRPDLCPPLSTPEAAQGTKRNVLFVCSGNAARSIMAEAVLRHTAGAQFEAHSAGIAPKPRVNALALETLERHGIPTRNLCSKPVSEYQTASAPRMDYVLTICDLAANADTPPMAGQPISAHWGLPNPSRGREADTALRQAFDATFAAIEARIAALLSLPLATLPRAAQQRHLDDIGRMTTAP